MEAIGTIEEETFIAQSLINCASILLVQGQEDISRPCRASPHDPIQGNHVVEYNLC